MTVEPDVDRMLTHRCTVKTMTDSVVAGVTTLSATSTQASVRCHLQPISPNDVQRFWGIEVVGDYVAWFNSTRTIDERQLITMTTEPRSGENFWVRGWKEVTDKGLKHKEALLERTNST